MNIIIERAALLRSLGHVQSVVERRNTIPILANVLLRADESGLSLATTDMELEIVESTPAEVMRMGSVTASAHTLYDIVRKLPDGVAIELDAPVGSLTLTLRAGRSQFRLVCLAADDYPQMSGGDMKHRFDIGVEDLRVLIDRTRFAISTEETRYYLNGIFLHATLGRTGDGSGAAKLPVLRAVATDGHRLARVDIPLPDGAAGLPGHIIPRKAVAEVRKLIDEVADHIQISMSDTKIRFSFDNIIVTSKLIDGTFPDYERVVPVGNDKILEGNAKEIASAVDRVATISTEKSRAVKFAITSNALVVSASSPDADSATEELEAQFNHGAIDIGYNSRYLLDIVNQIRSDRVRFIISDSTAPTIVSDVGTDAALFVLMPMRV